MFQEFEFQEFDKQNFDCLIDARSPREFKYSHISQAKNFYALNDNEFEEIGILYSKNQSLAKIKGASYICNNMAKHILELYKEFPLKSLIGIYCSRGGMRSKSVGIILSELGYRVIRLKGGYKAYRAYLNDYFSKQLNFKLLALCGNTGSGKTELLELLPQSINLEKLANHLGSAFGSILGDQPNQKFFETKLFENFKNIKTLAFIELESRRIGDIVLPLNLYEAMQNSFKIYCFCSLENRILRIEKFYKTKITPLKFKKAVEKITPYISTNFRLDLLNSYNRGDLRRVITMLLQYYDKVYKKPKNIDFVLNTDDIMQAKENLLNLFNLKDSLNLKS